MTEKTKHEFVDDNPYLVYSGDIDTSYNGDSGSGGGGGGDAGDSDVFWVEILGTSKDPTNWAVNPTTDASATSDFTLSATMSEIMEAINANKIVKVIADTEESGKFIFDLDNYSINPNFSFVYFTCPFISVDSSVLRVDFYALAFNSGELYPITGKHLAGEIEPNPAIQ